MVNRRMFRPAFADVKEQVPPRPQHGNNGPAPSKKPAPPEVTHAENFYCVKQMQAHTPMAVVLHNGEGFFGTVDKETPHLLKLTHPSTPQFVGIYTKHKYTLEKAREYGHIS